MKKKYECSREKFAESYKARIISETMTPRTEIEKKEPKRLEMNLLNL